jgi:hypothetical protein
VKAPILKMTAKLKLVLESAEHSAAEYLRHESLLLMSLIEVEKTKAYRCFGYTYLTTYCMKELNLSEDVAAIFVRVVRKSIEVPELAHAVIAGEIQITKAKAIASVITRENKAEWLMSAATKTKQELEKQIAKASGRETKPLTLELTHEEHERFDRLREVITAKFDHYPSKEETFAWSTEQNLNKHDPLRKADRSQDRSVNDQVVHRDREKCQAEMPDGTKCGETKWLHQHHMIPREFGGEDTAENLITLCSSHHRMVHAEIDQTSRELMDS